MEVGEHGESRVLELVIAVLSAHGQAPIRLEASGKDEDRVLEIQGERVILQIVTSPPDAKFWAAVSKKPMASQQQIAVATRWINDAIVRKANKYPDAVKTQMLLAVDIGHVGVLCSPVLLKSYLATFGDPSEKYYFGGVWLVGPTEDRCARLGKSRW